MVVIREPKTFHFNFDLAKDVDTNLGHEIEFIIKRNDESLAEHHIKTKLVKYCQNISIETRFMNTKNSKTNKPQKCVLNLSQRLDLRNSNRHVALENLSIYYTWKNIRQQYKNNKLKIKAPT